MKVIEKTNLKKGAKKILAITLSTLSFMGGIAAKASKPTEDFYCEAMEKMFCSKDEFIMNKLHNINDLFNFNILKIVGKDEIPIYDEEYWNKDITDKLLYDDEEECLKLTTSMDYYKASKTIKDIFGEDVFIFLGVLDTLNQLLYVGTTTKKDCSISMGWNFIKYCAANEIKLRRDSGELHITRKTLLKLIIVALAENRIAVSQEGTVLFSKKNLFGNYPYIPKEVMLLREDRLELEQILDILDNATPEECSKLLAFFPTYFAVNELIRYRILDIPDAKRKKFVKDNKELLNSWMNSLTIQEYMDCAETILDTIKAY